MKSDIEKMSGVNAHFSDDDPVKLHHMLIQNIDQRSRILRSSDEITTKRSFFSSYHTSIRKVEMTALTVM